MAVMAVIAMIWLVLGVAATAWFMHDLQKLVGEGLKYGVVGRGRRELCAAFVKTVVAILIGICPPAYVIVYSF